MDRQIDKQKDGKQIDRKIYIYVGKIDRWIYRQKERWIDI